MRFPEMFAQRDRLSKKTLRLRTIQKGSSPLSPSIQHAYPLIFGPMHHTHKFVTLVKLIVLRCAHGAFVLYLSQHRLKGIPQRTYSTRNSRIVGVTKCVARKEKIIDQCSEQTYIVLLERNQGQKHASSFAVLQSLAQSLYRHLPAIILGSRSRSTLSGMVKDDPAIEQALLSDSSSPDRYETFPNPCIEPTFRNAPSK